MHVVSEPPESLTGRNYQNFPWRAYPHALLKRRIYHYAMTKNRSHLSLCSRLCGLLSRSLETRGISRCLLENASLWPPSFGVSGKGGLFRTWTRTRTQTRTRLGLGLGRELPDCACADSVCLVHAAAERQRVWSWCILFLR